MDPFRFHAGDTPLLVSMPHVGTHVPAEIAARLSPAARSVPDTDWHVDRLYDFLDLLGASTIVATQSRYVIDLNRAPDSAPLYPGANNTELCPTTLFDETPLYLDGAEPDSDEIAARRLAIWQPYHERLRAELATLTVGRAFDPKPCAAFLRGPLTRFEFWVRRGHHHGPGPTAPT